MSGAFLKKIAVWTMLVDHLGAAFFVIYTSTYDGVADFAGADVLYNFLRIVGRTAFPIFCFLISEGAIHTRSKVKYALRLLVFALISEIPFDLAFFNQVWAMERQNVFFTLLLGFLSLVALEKMKRAGEAEGKWKLLKLGAWFAVVGICPVLAYVLRTDYEYAGVFLIMIFYLWRENRGLACLCGYLCMMYEAWCFPAFVLLYFYNGEKGKAGKYFYYVFYPAHLIVLFMLRIVCIN